MKGKLTKLETGWSVVAIEEGDWKTYYPLHPADAAEIEADSKRFDNIEARIAAYPDVEFEIEDFWETGLEEVVRVAKLVTGETDSGGLYTEAQVRMAIQKARVTNTENLMGTGVKLHRWSDDEIVELIKNT